jgi:hypothetical protein
VGCVADGDGHGSLLTIPPLSARDGDVLTFGVCPKAFVLSSLPFCLYLVKAERAGDSALAVLKQRYIDWPQVVVVCCFVVRWLYLPQRQTSDVAHCTHCVVAGEELLTLSQPVLVALALCKVLWESSMA